MEDDLSHELLQFLDRIQWNALLKSEHWLGGRNRSLKKGRSPQFKEYREYRQGEDAQAIDWKATARSKYPVVKEWDHQGILDHIVVLDASASMDFPAGPHHKFRRQRLLVGLLLYWFQSMGDRSSMVMGDQIDPPSRGQEGLHHKIGRLGDCVLEGEQNTYALLELLVSQLKCPSCLWFMTDFDRDPAELCKVYKAVLDLGHEVTVCHLYHPEEHQLQMTDWTIFLDSEEKLSDQSVNPTSLADLYRDQVQLHLQGIRKSVDQLGVHYAQIDVSSQAESWLPQILSDTQV